VSLARTVRSAARIRVHCMTCRIQKHTGCKQWYPLYQKLTGCKQRSNDIRAIRLSAQQLALHLIHSRGARCSLHLAYEELISVASTLNPTEQRYAALTNRSSVADEK
jgi:hypothetical protein